ncbi:MAG: CHAT domain-containing protein [Casimicrobiaceae bacterium]
MLQKILLSLGLVLCLCAAPISPAAAQQEGGPVPKTISDILLQLRQIKPDEAVRVQATKILNSEPPANAASTDLVHYYFLRSHANRTLGSAEQMLRDARKAAELARGYGDKLPGDAPLAILEGDALVELSDAEVWGGNYLNARKAREQLSRFRSLGWSHAGFAMVAIISADLGDLEGAEAALSADERILDKLRSTKNWSDWSGDYLARHERAKARLLRAKGKYREAEAEQRKAIAGTDISIETNPRLQYTTQSFLEARREELEVELAYILIAQNRLGEAEWHARTVLQRTLKRVSGSSPEIINRLGPLIEILHVEGRFIESRALTSLARVMLADSGAQPVARAFSVLLGAEGRTLVALGEYAQALERYSQIRANFALDPALRQAYGRGDADWGLALLKAGKPVEAAEMLGTLLRDSKARVGAGHLETGIVQGELGMALAAQGDRAGALAEFAAAMQSLLDPHNLNAAPPATTARIAIIVETYIGLLAEMQRRGDVGLGGIDPAAEAFRLADAIRGRSVQAAVVQSAARAAGGTARLGELVRSDQDLMREVVELWDVLNRQLAAPPDQQLPRVIARTRARIEAIDGERRKLGELIRKDFNAYADLIEPRPATVDETRKALAPGEVLFSVLVTPTASYVWAIPRSGAIGFAGAHLTGAEINELVASLRKSLDPGEVRIDRMPALDLAAGYRLYSELLAPVEPVWRDAKALLVVANGALTQLPLAMLPTQALQPVPDGELAFRGLASVPWLVKRLAVTQLPSVSTLVSLRKLAAPTGDRAPFAGFGDPQFSRTQVARAATTRGMHMRALAISRGPQEGTETQLSAGKAIQGRIEPADWIRYDQLPPLPDTREEILAIARALKADPQQDVHLGADASARTVRTLDLSGRRVLAFATHGLIAGDLPNLTQPALALAAPIDPGESGLLTLDDILGLKLNADWVVLSACNTAAGDGAGAEAISGLGRGFFYAGSRALLVTHWPVETVSARKLVTGIFERIAVDASLSRAEALRLSMLALMESTTTDGAPGSARISYAHPIFWAPYVLVGDPGR